MNTALLNDSNTTDEVVKDNKLVIYQMMTRLFSNIVTTNKPYGTISENGVGKFNEINDIALSELKRFGATHVWYTGVIEHATLTDYSKFGISRDDADVVKGRAGSPYAIKDYYDVNPDLADTVTNRMQEFESLIKRTHNNGLKVLIDFVPNHVARSYKSDAKPKGVIDLGEKDNKSKAFDAQNNFYYIPGKSFVVPADFHPLGNEKGFKQDGKFNENPAKATGNDVFNEAPSINDWFETAKLNYGVDIQNNKSEHFNPIPNTWVQMKDILLFWAEKNVDGFRCDMAEMVPTPFWNYAINEVKKVYPKIIFIAEIYNPKAYKSYLEKAGFDYLYDKVGFYDAVRRLTVGKGNVHELTNCWKSETRDISNHMLRFMENHDEQRIASKDFAGNAFDAIPGMVATATMNSGPVMIYFGQEVGEKAEGKEGFGNDDCRTTIFDYWGVPAHQAWMNNGNFDGGKLNDEQKQLRNFYSTLLNLCKSSEAIKSGKFYELQKAQHGNHYYNDSLRLSFLRYTEKEKLLIVCNFDKQHPYKGLIPIPQNVQQALNISHKDDVIDLLSNNKFKCTDKGVEIDLPPMQALIIKLD
ncbi:MAG: alpha-amylase family glycosyl hydrolase [Bacteroidia bacterium]